VYLPLGEKETEVAVGKSVQKKLKELLKSRILEKINDTEFQFSLLLGNFLLTGIVDATLDTGNGIEIIDWKNSVHDQFKERYRNQILVYALGLINMGIPIVQGRIFDLSHISKGHTVKVTKSTLDEVRTTTMQRFKDISQTRITVTPSKNACSICDVKEVCKYCMVRRSPDATRK